VRFGGAVLGSTAAALASHRARPAIERRRIVPQLKRLAPKRLCPLDRRPSSPCQ
jgi:hypothetical protein